MAVSTPLDKLGNAVVLLTLLLLLLLLFKDFDAKLVDVMFEILGDKEVSIKFLGFEEEDEDDDDEDGDELKEDDDETDDDDEEEEGWKLLLLLFETFSILIDDMRFEDNLGFLLFVLLVIMSWIGLKWFKIDEHEDEEDEDDETESYLCFDSADAIVFGNIGNWL